MAEGAILRAKMGYADKYVPEVVIVEPSTHRHRAGADLPQCGQYCCCAPDEVAEIEVVRTAGFEFSESLMPDWVSHGMQVANGFDDSERIAAITLERHYCSNCGAKVSRQR